MNLLAPFGLRFTNVDELACAAFYIEKAVLAFTNTSIFCYKFTALEVEEQKIKQEDVLSVVHGKRCDLQRATKSLPSGSTCCACVKNSHFDCVAASTVQG